MTTTPNARAPYRQSPIVLLLLVAMAATVGGALAFQHIGGYIPCKLCYEQRIPYYIGLTLMVVALFACMGQKSLLLIRLLLLVVAGLMAWGLYMGIYHSGVEWGWWAGPTDCGMVAPPPEGGSNGVLDQIDAVMPPSCDKAALRILGLSLAGWNAIASLVLGVVALKGALGRA